MTSAMWTAERAGASLRSATASSNTSGSHPVCAGVAAWVASQPVQPVSAPTSQPALQRPTPDPERATVGVAVHASGDL